MVLAILGTLSGYFRPSIITDDLVFRLHYNLTSVLLVAFSIIVSTKQFFGDPISCIPAARMETPLNLLDNYCWSHSTFTLPKAYNKPMGWGAQEVAYDGVDKEVEGDDVIYHAYYQWVCFFLFVQALLFYLTRYLWNNAFGYDLQKLISKKEKDVDALDVLQKLTEKDTEYLDILKKLVDEKKKDIEAPKKLNYYKDIEALGDILKLIDKKKKDIKTLDDLQKRHKDIEALAGYLNTTMGCHGLTVATYFLCLVLNGANAISQMYLTNAFLQGDFMTYGERVLHFSMGPQFNRTDPMVQVFPLMTKCKFPRYGVGGSVEIRDTLCVLPVNVINEKIFIFLWFWYAVLAIVSLAWILCQLPFFFSRCRLVVIRCQKTEEVRDALEKVMLRCNLGDWFLLRIVEKNFVAMDFNTLVDRLLYKLMKSSERTEDKQPLLASTSHRKSQNNQLA